MKEMNGTVVEARMGGWSRRVSRVSLLLALLASGAAASDVVVPSAWTATQGPTNNNYPLNFFSPGGVGRYQQVFAASDFLGSGVGFPIVITDLSFRPGQAASSSYALAGRTLTVDLSLSDSTAGPDALSATFAANVSGPAATVYSGALVLPTVPSFPGPGPHPFVWTIPLQIPYLYAGTSDLLLDISVLASTAAPGFPAPLDAVDASGDAVSRQYNQGNPFSPTASGGGSVGLIARFSYESLFAPFGAGCAGAGGYVPTIGSSGGAPTLGNSSFAITLADATGGGGAFLVIGASDVSWLGIPLPIGLDPFGGPGCLLLVSGDVLIGVPVSGSGAGGGSATVPTPIPANPSLSLGTAFVQWIPSDPIAGGIRASNAAAVTLF